MKLGLENQVVLMTGATSGMGPEIARAFAEEGAVLALLTRRPEAVEGLARDLGPRATVHRCDITDADSCNAAAAEAEAAHGGPYALINLAGGSGPIGKPAWTPRGTSFTTFSTSTPRASSTRSGPSRPR
jgi:NAD(P)-dependent dehydrogenase (short-subunit alcohol dehydrogenase family)